MNINSFVKELSVSLSISKTSLSTASLRSELQRYAANLCENTTIVLFFFTWMSYIIIVFFEDMKGIVAKLLKE